MARRSVVLGGLVACLASVAVAIACGPEFPWQLLDDRPGTLRATPANGFDFEAARLVPRPAGSFRVEEGDLLSSGTTFADQVARAEAEGLPEALVATIKLMRAQTTGRAAYDSGAGLPEAIRLYTAGAVAYREAEFFAALTHFTAVLALPEAGARERAVWAAFMRGRIHAEIESAEAVSAFEDARRRAVTGAPDPLGLAVASYGEQARIWLRYARYLSHGAEPVPPEAEGFYGAAAAGAVELYAQQAALGSQRAILSLRIVAKELLADRTRINAVIADPIVRNLLVAYALAFVDDEAPADATGYDGSGARIDAGQGRGVTPNAVIPLLLDAIEKSGAKDVEGADRLAALAYRTGRFDLAERAASLQDTALSQWVRAKLAIRRGDLDAAAASYAAAAKEFPKVPKSLDDGAGQLLSGERGVLSLARGEYQLALRFLLAGPTPYWPDASYVAERVLTTDELLHVVADANPRGGPIETPPEALAKLKDLLARRLMRDGRYREALPYFSDDLTRFQAKAYADAVERAQSRWSRESRARAAFAAAVLARRHGLEMMGSEGPPDYAYWSGQLGGGVGRDTVSGELVRSDETARVAASGIRPNQRWHYRYLSVDHASRAADLLPARSQAFAAVLCWADRWMQQTPESGERGPELWRRYVREGAVVPFAPTFGRECPEPDFAGIGYASRPAIFQKVRRLIGWR